MVASTVFLLFILPASATLLEDFYDQNCSRINAEKRLQDAGDGGNCLAALRDPLYHQEFEKCKENVCFLFLHEPPFVTYSKDFFHNEQNLQQMQLPFLCKNPRDRHRSLGGSALSILRETSAGNEYCAWVGLSESCTWNALVDFVAVMGEKEQYQFAIVGPMLETPGRKCTHVASTSWWDGRMVVLGRNKRENLESVHPIWQLISPFQKETWIVVGSVIALFVIVSLMIVYRFHIFRGKSLITAVAAYFVLMGERAEALATGRVGIQKTYAQQHSKAQKESSNDLERALSSQDPLSSEDSLRTDTTDSKAEEEVEQQEEFFTKFSLSTSLFRISLIAFVAMFSLFYEVAVVNFLFQQQNLQITKDIEHLTMIELTRYAIVRDTALEAIWNMRVNPGGTKFDERVESQIPWKRCQNGSECFSWILDDNNPVQFYVTYELEGTHLIQTEATCELVTMFDTKGSIHHFNSGWLFNEQVPVKKRRKFDQELGALKIRGTLSDLIGGRSELCSPSLVSSISFAIILLPVVLLVLPPLMCSAIVALCWLRTKAREDNESTSLPE